MKFSIITINYNNAIGLERTIKSIISQSDKNFQYIVIDGGSTDKSVEIINKYAYDIDYWMSESDKGIYNAMNKGIQVATGDYLLFINSGDELYNNDVLKDVSSYNPTHDLVYGDLNRVYPATQNSLLEIAPDNASIYFVLKCSLHHPSTFIKRELFQKYGLYREDLKIVSDWAFFLHLVAFTNTTKIHIPVTIASFNMDGISSDSVLVENEKNKVINETFSPELLDILEFHQNFYVYNRFYHKKIFVIIRKILNIFRQKKNKN